MRQQKNVVVALNTTKNILIKKSNAFVIVIKKKGLSFGLINLL